MWPTRSNVNSRDVKLRYLEMKAKRQGTEKAYQAVQEELQERNFQTTFFKMLAMKTVGEEHEFSSEKSLEALMGSYPSINFECLKSAIESYETDCAKLGEFGLTYVRVFVNLCNSEYGKDIPKMINEICPLAKDVVVIDF